VKLEWTYAAEADRQTIFDYISSDNPRAAIALDERIQAAASLLVRFPYLGRPGRVQNTRELVAHRHYVLAYEVEGDIVHILRMLHTSLLWPPRERL
jgi:toxin ParE1/3/4